jgi:hypothetical protein
MRLRVGLVMLLLVAAYGVVACGAGEATTTSRGISTTSVPTTSAPATSADKGGTLTQYSDAIDDWYKRLEQNMPPEMVSDAQGNPDIDDSAYRKHVEGEKASLSALVQMSPPQTLAEEHQLLLQAFKVYYQADLRFQEAEARKDYAGANEAAAEADSLLYKVEDAFNRLLDAIDAAK